MSPTAILIAGPEAVCEWREANRMLSPGYQYTRAYQAGRWDGTWAPGNWCRMRGDDQYELKCSRGLLERVFHDLGAPCEPATSPEVAAFLQTLPADLRDFQRDAIALALTHRWGRVALATNAGKGAVLALLAVYAREHNIPALICCDEIAVYDALLGEIRQWGGFEPGLLRAGERESGALVTLAMIPTLTKCLGPDEKDERTADNAMWREWLTTQQMLLLDEADKATAETWRRICTGAMKSAWRIGFSGTFPDARTYADWQLETLMGPILLEEKNAAMVARGISATPFVALHSYDATSALLPLPAWDAWRAMRGADRRLWAYETAIVNNAHRHQFIAGLIRPDTPTAIIVNRIDHGEQLTAAIPGAVFLDGSNSERGRIIALEAFRTGKIRVLVVTKILDRGTNRLGWADDVIFASGEGSLRQTLQRIGRGLRRAGGKATLRLVDVIDRVMVAPDSENDRLERVAEYLHSAGRKRTRLYGAEGFDVRIIRA